MIPEEVRRLHQEGWSLIPVGADKKALVAWKPYQATAASLEQIEEWASTLAPAVWAGATGQVSGRISLDFDIPDGPATMTHLGLSAHRATPSGGYHVDVVYPGWNVTTLSGKAKKSLGERYPGLDVRGTGGYINLTGTTSTGSYAWISDNRHPLPLDLLPESLRDALGLLHPPSSVACLPADTTVAVAVEQESAQRKPLNEPPEVAIVLARQALDRVADGGRNQAGFWLACQLRDERVSYEDSALTMRVYAMRTPEVNSKGLREPYTADEAIASLQQAWKRPRRSPWQLIGTTPTIHVTDRQLSDLTVEAVDAIGADNEPPHVFIRGGAVTRILRDEAGRPRTDVLRAVEMRHLLSQVATWTKDSKFGGPPLNALPPVPVANDLLVRQWNELPALTGLIEAPCLRPDGTLLSAPGWDEQTGLWLDPDSKLTVPVIREEPSDADITATVHLLQRELLGEFAFVDAASEANALALVLTAVLRPAIDGLVPLALIGAPIAGTGKTMLVNLAARIATGRPAGLTAAPNRDNDEELRKRLTALLIAGESLIVFDNVANTLSSPVLAQALTSEVWADRVLGVSKVVQLPQRAVWAATGNHIQLGGDLARRCYPINLDPKTAEPWRRQFRRPDLDQWAIEHRGALLAAALTLGRAWYARGCPDGGAPQWGSYQRWAQVMAGILTTAGVPGFLDNLQDLYTAADSETAGWQRVLAHWHFTCGEKPVRTSELDGALLLGEDLDLPPSIASAIGYAPDAGTRHTRLSAKIRAVQDRRFDDTGLRIERAGTDAHSKGALWLVTRDRAPASEPAS